MSSSNISACGPTGSIARSVTQASRASQHRIAKKVSGRRNRPNKGSIAPGKVASQLPAGASCQSRSEALAASFAALNFSTIAGFADPVTQSVVDVFAIRPLALLKANRDDTTSYFLTIVRSRTLVAPTTKHGTDVVPQERPKCLLSRHTFLGFIHHEDKPTATKDGTSTFGSRHGVLPLTPGPWDTSALSGTHHQSLRSRLRPTLIFKVASVDGPRPSRQLDEVIHLKSYGEFTYPLDGCLTNRSPIESEDQSISDLN